MGSSIVLSYLHDHYDPKIIHLDVKAANILLHEEFEDVVEDFGLTKLMTTRTPIFPTIQGTIGHIALKYIST